MAREPTEVGIKVRESFAWDRELRGFGVQVSPSGLKSFVIQYRNADGRNRRIVIGRYGLTTVEEARRLADEKLVAVSTGTDPAAKQATNTGSHTVAEICDWYLREAEAGRILGRSRRPIKASTLAMDRSRIAQHIKLLLGSRRVKALTLGDVEGMQADIARGKTSKARAGSRGGATTGGEGVASRTVSTLHSLLEHAARPGVIAANPAKGVRKLAVAPRERRRSAAEIAKLGRAMRAALEHGEHPTGLAAVRFPLLTGFRRQEGLGLERAWVDAEHRCVRLPDTKNGAQLRVVGKAAMNLIALPSARPGSRFVFPATGRTAFHRGGGHAGSSVRERQARRSTPHVLRHTFASIAADLGFSELTIAALLGHAARGVTQRLPAYRRGRAHGRGLSRR